MIAFDIETGPLPDDELRIMLPPFVEPEHPGEFDPALVKYGNTKDVAKRADKLEEERAKHALAVLNHEQDVAVARDKHWLDFKDKAALSPLTGKVLAIGLKSLSGESVLADQYGEKNLIGLFWDMMADFTEDFAGWNIFQFDLPFLIRRSWKLGVPVPAIRVNQDRYWSPRFVDLMVRFAAGGRNVYEELGDAAKFLGVGQKSGNGADFARLWNGAPEEREQARQYLLNDLDLTYKIGLKLGVN